MHQNRRFVPCYAVLGLQVPMFAVYRKQDFVSNGAFRGVGMDCAAGLTAGAKKEKPPVSEALSCYVGCASIHLLDERRLRECAPIGIGREPTFHPKQRLQVYPRLFELQERRNANVVDAGAFVRQPKHLAVSACHLIIPLGLGRFD